MGKYGKITEALAASSRKAEALEAKMAEARAKYEEALTQQTEREEAANDMRRELLGRYAWRYCRAGQLIPQLDKLIRSGDSDIDEQRTLFGLAPLTEKEKEEAAKEEAALEAVLIPATEPHPAVEAKKRAMKNGSGEARGKRGRKRKNADAKNDDAGETRDKDAVASVSENVPQLEGAETEPGIMDMDPTETDPEERFGVFDAEGEEDAERQDDAPTPEMLTGFEDPPMETVPQSEDVLPIMDAPADSEFPTDSESPAFSTDPLLF